MLKKKILNKRKKERRAIKRNTPDRRVCDEHEEVEYVDMPNYGKCKHNIPDDFNESEYEKIMVEHATDNPLLSMVPEVNDDGKNRASGEGLES